MVALTCAICLGRLTVPVCTPCGHLCCEVCLQSHIEASPDVLSASCPTCRANFSIVNPEALSLKEKYRSFLIPSIRRVYIPIDIDDDEEDAAREAEADIRRGLRAQIVSLSEKVDSLERDRAMLMDRCEAAQAASAVHAQGERDERLAREKLEREMRELRQKYEGLKGKYKVLKATQENPRASFPKPSYHLNMKRTSTQASLDSIHHLVSSGPDSQDESTTSVEHPSRRPASRLPKRPRLLGSPFDLNKRIEGRTRARRARAQDDEDEDATLLDSDLSLISSVGPQHSGLPRGDIFSPGHRSSRSGRASSVAQNWLMTPEDDR